MRNGATSAPEGPSRRRVLQLAGAAALAAAELAVPRSASAAGGASPGAYDAIVVGAGFAGVTAARELRAKGLRPLILEARDRIGGRTWTADFDGTPVEMGGESVDEKQPYVWQEVQRYRIPLATGSGADRMYLPASGGGYAAVPTAEAAPRLDSLFTPLFDGSHDYFPRPYEPLYATDLLRPIDQLSMRDRLNQLRLSAFDESWVTGTLGSLSGGSSKHGAFSMLAQSWALSGYTFAKYLSINTYHPATGTQALLEAMLADAKAHLVLRSPVTAIEQSGRSVEVTTTGGRVYSAPVAVLAVPVNVWKTIRFSPALPNEYVGMSLAGIGAPNVQKLWLRVRGAIGRFATNPVEGSRLGAVRPHTVIGNEILMFGFAYDTKFDGSNPAVVQAKLRQIVPDVEVVAAKAHTWATDPFALGGWSCRQPGMLTGSYSAIQRPQGRIAFATSDIANGWSGYIDGAIESGRTAAAQVAALAATVA